MTIRALPKPQAFQRPAAFEWDTPASALQQWSSMPSAAAADDPDTISIFDVIGEDWWTGEGFTAKRMSAALRSIGPKPVTVKINSPGGDLFEGLAIYNLLREHPAKVSIEVFGLSASAASVVTMAGDDIAIAMGAMLMIHKAWGLVVGNSDDFTDAASVFDKFDASMADIYAARSGLSVDAVKAMLAGPGKASDGTWLTASEAVEKGFADRVINAPSPAEGDASARVDPSILARRRVEAALAREGVSRKAREDILTTLIPAARDAGRASPARRDAGGPAIDLALAQSAIASFRL